MSDPLAWLPVVPYTRTHVPNPYPGGDLPWQAYHAVRNAVVRACREHGPTGVMGEVTIAADVADPYRAIADDIGFWERGDPSPTYFVVADQLNHERYCYVELHGDAPLTAGWLASIVDALRRFDGWGVGVMNVPGSYALVFTDRLMVSGRLAGCRSAGEVVATARRLFRRRPWWQFWR